MIALCVRGIPLFMGFFVLWRFVGLQFFSTRRSTPEEVQPGVKELNIEEFEATVSAALDERLLSSEAQLSVHERQQARAKRLEFIRQSIFIILDNVVLFRQAGRFRIARIEREERELSFQERQLIYQLFDTAAVCHILCASALIKVRVLKAYWVVRLALVPPVGAIAADRNRFAGLQFFSARRSDLAEVLPMIRDLDIAEFEATVSVAIEEYLLSNASPLSVHERKQAYAKRLEFIRQRVFIMLDNVVLFQQVGRFKISQIEREGREFCLEEKQLIYQLFDTAAICHVLCASTLMKVSILKACRPIWPAIIPPVGAIAVVRGQNLVTLYGAAVKCLLEMARRDHRDWIHDNLLFALAGPVAVERTQFCRDRR